MINLNLRLSLILLAVASVSACSSNAGTDVTSKSDTQPTAFLETTAEQATSNELLSDGVSIEYLRIKHHEVECEGFNVRLCLLVQKEGSDDWEYFYETIEGFDYQWGTEYEVLVQVQDNEPGPADMPAQRYSLLDVVTTTANNANIAFEYVTRNSDERFVETAPGEFSILGDKTFTCTADSCDALRSAIAQNHTALLTFVHTTDLAAPLVLEAVLCSDAATSFDAACR